MLSGSADIIYFPAVACSVQVSEAVRGVTFVQAVEVHASTFLGVSLFANDSV